MNNVREEGAHPTPPARVDAGVKERNEMTIGRTDDPENPHKPVALEAAQLFGTGSRIPSVGVDGPTASNVPTLGR
jgi:hypothetical protein